MWLRLVCVLSVLAAGAYAAAPLDIARQYSHRIWRVQDGLPQNRIQAISQTQDGYLWIGTSGGLVRFDGARFTVFDRSNAPEFGDDSILALASSKDGSLWVGTEGGGLLHYHDGSFTLIDTAQGLTNGFVRALHEDSKGILWIGTDRGFFRLDGSKQDGSKQDQSKVERLDDRSGIPITAITGLTEDRQGRIWAAAGIGLLSIENGALRRVLPDNQVLSGVRGVVPASDGALWLITLTGLWRLENNTLTPYRAIGEITPLTVLEDSEANLWIGALGSGLLKIDPSGALAVDSSDILPGNTVFSIVADREGNLWIGTQDGLLRLSRTAVRTFTSRDGIDDENISTIYSDRDGTLWFVTITGQIYRYAAGKIQPFHLQSPRPDMRIRQAYRDRKGVLWFGTSDDGIIRLADNRATLLSTNDGLRNNSIRQFYEDRSGDLWIALGSGLSRWDGHKFHNYYIEDGLAYGSVRIVMEDRRGDVLVGTERGLNRIHDGKFVPDPAFAQLNDQRIWALHEDSDGALWIGTRGGGLFRIKDGKLGNLSTSDGLLSNTIYSVLEDTVGNFWLSTPAGIFSALRADLNRVLDGPRGPLAIVPYGTASGLESAQMNGGLGISGVRTASGELWFPSVKGAVRIDPSEVRVTQPFPVFIEKITADDRQVTGAKEIRIPPGPGKLTIEYSAVSLLSPERVTFEYRLEGLDDTWTAASTHRTAYYTNLSPGRYRFRVTARDSAAPLNSSEASVSLVLEPHYYQTSWFYALCALLAGLCVWAAFRVYARQTQARYAVLLAERARLAREMHDTVIQGCVGVSTLLEAASGFQPTDASRTKELMEQARVQVRSTLDEARQAVWDLRHDEYVEGDFAQTLRDMASHLSAEKGIPIEVEFAQWPKTLEQRTLRSLLLVTREAIRNAANHAVPGKIRIRMSCEAGEVRLEVQDDGCGFTPATELAETNGHYGIVGMRERVEQLGGTFVVQSTPGEGTAVVARLPVRGA